MTDFHSTEIADLHAAVSSYDGYKRNGAPKFILLWILWANISRCTLRRPVSKSAIKLPTLARQVQENTNQNVQIAFVDFTHKCADRAGFL